MIVIINGPCGVGKTTVAWELNARFHRAVMLDGDYIGAVHPFAIYDEARVDYLYRTLRHLVAFHVEEGGYEHFIINYVFESPESLAQLQTLLADLAGPVVAFRLRASDEALERRIRAREERPDWYLRRYRELVAIQERAARRGEMGILIDTTGLTAAEVVDRIWARLQGWAGAA
ncbi:MAG: AAA family ATPase [Anaerolineales bacterium]